MATQATGNLLNQYNKRIANGKTGNNFLAKNNLYVGSSADNATQATQAQIAEYNRRVQNGKTGQNYLNKNNIYIGNRDAVPMGKTANDNQLMNDDYYNMVYNYDIAKPNTDYLNQYQQNMEGLNYTPQQIQDTWSKPLQDATNNIDYGNASLIDEGYYKDYKNTLNNINGIADVDTLYDWRRDQATDSVQRYMASLGLSGSGAEAQAISDAVNKVTSEDAIRYENLLQQEAQRQTNAANQLAQQGYNLYGQNAQFLNDLNNRKIDNQYNTAQQIAQYGYNQQADNANMYNNYQQNRYNQLADMYNNMANMNYNVENSYANALNAQGIDNSNKYQSDTKYETERRDTINQNNIRNALEKLQMLLQYSSSGVNNSAELTQQLNSIITQLGLQTTTGYY